MTHQKGCSINCLVLFYKCCNVFRSIQDSVDAFMSNFINLQQRINKLPQVPSDFSFGKDIDDIHLFIFHEYSDHKKIGVR